MPSRVLSSLGTGRGVVVLAVDGLPLSLASSVWPSVERLVSTFPSTSVTGWLTALTGAGPEVHGGAGMVYRVPASGNLVYAVSGAVLASGPPVPGGAEQVLDAGPTLFERASSSGFGAAAIGRELDTLAGPWAPALLRGARRVPSSADLAEDAASPPRLARSVVAEVSAALSPGLLWVYVNLDDHLHRHGPDAAAEVCVRLLGEAAERWAGQGWTVVAHSDHGHTACTPDPELARAWASVDTPELCFLPSGGAGRTRWLYPRPGRAAETLELLRAALGPSADVATAASLGLSAGALAGRVGEVVAVARTAAFPIPDPALAYEHGGTSEEEVAIPYAVWHP